MILIFKRRHVCTEVQAVSGVCSVGISGVQGAPSSFLEGNRFSAFPAVNGSKIRNARVLRKVMVQLGTRAHKAVKTTARTSVKCCGEASKGLRAHGGSLPLPNVYRLPGTELAHSPVGVVGQVADGAAETGGWRHCQ